MSDNFGGSTLYGLDASTGAVVATLAVGATNHVSTPTVADGRLLIATTNRVLAYTGPPG
jgi:hypothetical protein